MNVQMRRYRLPGILVLLLLLVLSIPVVQAQPSRTGTISLLTPDNDTIPASRDFATEVIGDPWDMDQPTDIFFEDTRKSGFRDLVVSNGFMSGITTTADPSIWIMEPGIPDSQMLGHTGAQYPIDATRYTRLVFRMYLSSARPDEFLQIFWYVHGRFDGTGYGASCFLPLRAGWYIYDINLATVGRIAGDTDWAGTIRGFRIDPLNKSIGVTVKLDWVQLIDPSTAPTYDIRWSAVGAGSEMVSLYYDTDQNGSHKQLFATGIPATQGSYAWTPCLAPGNYYVFAQLSGGAQAASPGSLGINHPPVVAITAPSMTSGPDYATVEAGNPWDMNDPGDITWMYDIASHEYADGIFNASTTGNDPQLRLNTPKPIDTHKYRYYTCRMYLEGTQDIGTGWVHRVYFYNTPWEPGILDDVVIYEGWRTYTLDLQTASIESISRYHWTDGQWTWFRFDVDEMPSTMRFHLDYVKLTANDEADAAFNIRWELNDPDSTDVTLELYAVDGQNQRTLIGIVANGQVRRPSMTQEQVQPGETYSYTVYLPLVMQNYCPPCDQEGNCFTWYTTDIPAGTYYIQIEADDGYNHTEWTSETPVVIKH